MYLNDLNGANDSGLCSTSSATILSFGHGSRAHRSRSVICDRSSRAFDLPHIAITCRSQSSSSYDSMTRSQSTQTERHLAKSIGDSRYPNMIAKSSGGRYGGSLKSSSCLWGRRRRAMMQASRYATILRVLCFFCSFLLWPRARMTVRPRYSSFEGDDAEDTAANVDSTTTVWNFFDATNQTPSCLYIASNSSHTCLNNELDDGHAHPGPRSSG
mmetsp:Transcript_14028/g.40194  ORF Transcript_14028/g.40194 Transcript_14028/m.40194 type:complete len:214 (-) Transcript_14028:585-1226(-)